MIFPIFVAAHPMIEISLDVVIWPNKVVIDARVPMEEILLTATQNKTTPPREQWAALAAGHGDYVVGHILVKADGLRLAGHPSPPAPMSAVVTPETMLPYHIEYPCPDRPQQVKIIQTFLREFPAWSALCIVRVRLSTASEFESTSLNREGTLVQDCDWSAVLLSSAPPATLPTVITTRVAVWTTIWEYLREGIHHILTGYDHLLFVSALILAATRFWDLIKVVTAFTIAHSCTLTLSVLNIASLGSVSSRLVEPMIGASIVVVAVQNIFWPRQSRGWSRFAVAFAFGLFHGLGFASGLKEAMSAMPPRALWAALVAFSIGVELGHQIVVIPLFTAINLARNWGASEPRVVLSRRLTKYGSCLIALAGMYYFIAALRGE